MAGRVLVTGLGGFTGPYVRAALQDAGYEVLGASEQAVNLLDSGALKRYVAGQHFDHVVHLAGISSVAHEEGGDFYRVHVVGTLNLLEAVARCGAPVKKIVVASSANVYGRPARIPIGEEMPPAPLNDYGVSKLAMELMARLWFERLPILAARPFNYTGAGQSEKFVLPKIVAHFRNKAASVELGDTLVVREFMDVRDVALVYVRLLECAAASEVVNICSGTGHRLDEVLASLRRLSGHELQVRSSPALRRGNEIHELVGSPAKLAALIGEPVFRPLEETLQWMLDS